jgi:hypothetical protein
VPPTASAAELKPFCTAAPASWTPRPSTSSFATSSWTQTPRSAKTTTAMSVATSSTTVFARRTGSWG